MSDGRHALGLKVTVLELRSPEDIAAAFDSLHGNAEALYVVADAMTNAGHARIVTLALAARLPTMFGTSDLIGAGGLLAYGPSLVALFRRTGDYVDKFFTAPSPAIFRLSSQPSSISSSTSKPPRTWASLFRRHFSPLPTR
jgi:putative ABC transport system substrate-binding protein